MPKFTVTAEETITNEYDVMANDIEDASEQVKDMFYNSFASSIDANTSSIQIIEVEEN
jgi:ribosomal protein L20A (L18A)|tara:strand:- start:4829 stop:5002 length:174 start_codon:yes stop_codon:yes gene_type:complete